MKKEKKSKAQQLPVKIKYRKGWRSDDYIFEHYKIGLRLIVQVNMTPKLELEKVDDIVCSRVRDLIIKKNLINDTKNTIICKQSMRIISRIDDLMSDIANFHESNNGSMLQTYALTQVLTDEDDPKAFGNIQKNMTIMRDYFLFIANNPRQGFNDHDLDMKDYIGNYLVRDFREIFGSEPIANYDLDNNTFYGPFIDFARFIFTEAGFSRADVSDATIRAYRSAYDPDDPRFVYKETPANIEKDKKGISKIA